jgi:AAA domain
MLEADACAAVRRISDGGDLDLLFELHFDRLGVVTVADVTADPKTYVEQPLADPIEGVAYGRGTAKLYKYPDGLLWVNSFAHGGCTYMLPPPDHPPIELTFDDVDQATVERIAAQDAERERQGKARRGADDTAKTLADLKARLGAVHASAYRGVPSPPMEWFVKDLIPAYDFTVINGDGGVGKSLLGLQLQICSVAKREWLGMPVKHGPAIFFSGEDSKDENHRRLERIAQAEGIDLGALDDLIILNKAGKKVTLMSKSMNAELSPTMLWRDLEQLTRFAKSWSSQSEVKICLRTQEPGRGPSMPR